MSFITKNLSNLIEKKFLTKEVRRPFYKKSRFRSVISPEYLAAVIKNGGPEEYMEVVDKVMALYKAKEISKGEAQARLYSLAKECAGKYK